MAIAATKTGCKDVNRTEVSQDQDQVKELYKQGSDPQKTVFLDKGNNSHFPVKETIEIHGNYKLRLKIQTSKEKKALEL